jgi:2-haloacid dehalogenase
LFTLFDPRGVDQRAEAVLPDKPAFAATWKAKLFEYSWLRAAADQYVDFEVLVKDALAYAARAHQVSLADSDRALLENAFTELTPWPDSASVLERLRARGLKLAPLANFAPRMIERLLGRANLLDHFDALISTDQARSYKPDPRAYALAETTFGLPRKRIAFAAFGGWDAAGARWFGFPTFRVNRLSQPDEALGPIDASGPDLLSLERWLIQRG